MLDRKEENLKKLEEEGSLEDLKYKVAILFIFKIKH